MRDASKMLIATAILLAACPEERSWDQGGKGRLFLDLPVVERTFAQPLAVVHGDAFDGRGVSVEWENKTAWALGPDARGTAEVWPYVKDCIIVLPCPPLEERRTTGFVAAVRLLPGTNRVRVSARDLDGSWAWEEVDLRFEPQPGAASIAVTGANPAAERAYVVGNGSGLVALELRSELTGETEPVRGSYFEYGDPGWLPTDLTFWGGYVDLAPGVNRITALGTGWDGSVASDTVDVTPAP